MEMPLVLQIFGPQPTNCMDQNDNLMMEWEEKSEDHQSHYSYIHIHTYIHTHTDKIVGTPLLKKEKPTMVTEITWDW